MAKNTQEQEQLFIKYGQNPSIFNRNKIIEEYYPTVKRIAYGKSKKLNWKVLPEELTSYGIDGLITAIGKYKLEENDSFIGFASHRISGSMLDNMRRIDLIPRSVRIHYKEFEDARDKLESEKCRLITDYEVAEELGLSVDKYNQRISSYHPTSFASLEGSDMKSSDENDFFKNDYSNALMSPKELDSEIIIDADYIYKTLKREFINIFAKKKKTKKKENKTKSSGLLFFKIWYDFSRLGLSCSVVSEKYKVSKSLIYSLQHNKFKPAIAAIEETRGSIDSIDYKTLKKEFINFFAKRKTKTKTKGRKYIQKKRMTGTRMFNIWYDYNVIGYTMDAIAKKNNISESRVSQLHKHEIQDAIDKIKEKYGWNNCLY